MNAPERVADPTHHESIEFEAVVRLLGDEYAREVLEAITQQPRTAAEIADRCEASRVTVYRRLNELDAAGVVAASTELDSDGNHANVYHNRLAELTLSVCADGFEGSIRRTDDRGRRDRRDD